MIEFRSLRQEELEAWFEHCAYVFGGGNSDPILKGVFMSHYYMDPSRDLNGILVAVEDNQIISTVRVFYRSAYFFGKEITVGGIGEVSTRPEHQGKGLAYRLLEIAIGQMKERGTDLSILRGTARLYHNLGWRSTMSYTQVSRVVGMDDLSYRMRPADFDHDIPALKAIHKEYSKRFNGAFTRDDDYYWRFWIRMESRNLWVIEDDNDSIIGYVSFRNDKGFLDIHEFCVISPMYDHLFDQIVSKLCFMLNRKTADVRFESLIKSKINAVKFEKNESGMYMLLNPISIGDELIESTDVFIDRLKGITEASQDPVSDTLFWGIDSF